MRTLDDALRRELLEHATRLRLILSAIGVSTMALRRQEAEADADIASVLSESAWLPLDTRLHDPRYRESRASAVLRLP